MTHRFNIVGKPNKNNPEFQIDNELPEFNEAAFLNDLENEIVINIMLELIFDREISTNQEDAVIKVDNKPTALYDDGKFLYFPIFHLKEMIEASGFEISILFLSHALTAMGYKSEGSMMACFKTTDGFIVQECWELVRKWGVKNAK